MQHDILINNTKVKWETFDPAKVEIVYIDSLLEPLSDFLMSFQTECEAEYCGIDAFKFDRKNLEKNRGQVDKKIIQDLTRLKRNVSNIESPVVASVLLNQLFDKQVFLQLIDGVLDYFSSSETKV